MHVNISTTNTSQTAQTGLEANPPSLFLIKIALHFRIVILHQNNQKHIRK